ncbi:hypothetical protein DICPUDRAFT_98748 [Dictyostelium purpureum]|uniref:Threonine/serine exporter-like N-terminal domain-containing protein n=1 Tax=Dictyostelium purpureum TaxID=5786 RepID=F0ZT76_DICPU|nr:uncharacterized protein DICPUDRAFT_98748 [Dictyostelium purpureum]EGC32868.1 hypothetical protein DICPUDRAFT_98748 [Dictyostelium purpureum]|eukprot:XP_003290620.1 hypothetical protein DICPUDRAFT_98748 [Dictyostelium purpureum]
MYNFWERIKAPLAEYRKKNPYKKDDDSTELPPGTTIIPIPTTSNINDLYSSNINIPGPNTTTTVNNLASMASMAPVPSLPISILKQSQMISNINTLGSSSPRGFFNQSLGGNTFTNPNLHQNIGLTGNVGNIPQTPSHLITPQSPSINPVTVLGINPLGSTTSIPGQSYQQPQQPTPALIPNVITVPMEVSEITPNTPISIPSTNISTTNPPSGIGSAVTSTVASPSLQHQPYPSAPPSSSVSGNQSPTIFSPYLPQQNATNHLYPQLYSQSPTVQQQNQQLLQHLSNLHQNHTSQYQNNSPNLFSHQQQQQPQQNDLVQLQNSLGEGIEMKEFRAVPSSIISSPGLKYSQLQNNSNTLSSSRHQRNISTESFLKHSRNRSTDHFNYYFNPNTLGQSTINVDQQNIPQQHEHIKPNSEKSTVIPINELASNTNSFNETNFSPLNTEGAMRIPKIPKKKSRFNKEKMKKFKKSVYQILSPETQLPIHVVDNDQMENTVIPFLMELGRALLMSGVPAHRLEYELTLISGTFGIDGHFFTTPTGIFFSFGSPHTILSPYTHFLRIHSTDYNMNRLILLEELADQVIYGHMNCADGLVRLKEILRSKPLYNNYLTVISFILSSFAIAFFFKAGWVEVGACSFVGLYVGLLYAIASKYATIGRVLEALSACGGAILASLFNAFIYPVHIFMVTLAGIIALAPGLSLTIAVAEISTRNLISGNARMMGVFACLLQLTFGIALGTKISAKILPLQIEVNPVSLPAWTMFLAVPVAAISFAVQMKVHPKQIWVITLASVLGILCGNWGNKFFGEDVGSFFGSCAICLLGNLYARFTNTSASVPIFVGIILLVPGSMGIKGLVSVSTGDITGGLQLFGGMFMIAASLTIGLLVANLLVKPNKAL